MQPRRKISFFTIVLIGVAIGFFIKNVKIGLIIGLLLGLMAGGIVNAKSK
jgi:F0F1-type ATP synthase assembly protein I